MRFGSVIIGNAGFTKMSEVRKVFLRACVRDEGLGSIDFIDYARRLVEANATADPLRR
jgi:hypothetical protein